MTSLDRFAFAAALAPILTACGSSRPPATPAPRPLERVYAQPVHRWFEDAFLRAQVSPDGGWVLAGKPGGVELVSLATHAPDDARARGPLDAVRAAFFCGDALLRWGKRGDRVGLFAEGGAPLDLGDARAVACAPSGGIVATYRPEDDGAGLDIGSWTSRRHAAVPGRITAAAFSRAGDVVYALAWHDTGASSLLSLDVATGTVRALREGLDAAPGRTAMSISPDGDRLYLSLVGLAPPSPAERQRPRAGRWLDVWAYGTRTGELQPVVRSPLDKLSPREVDGFVYWSQLERSRSVVAFPAAGGPAHLVVEGAEAPSWSPDGKLLGFAFGEWRVADWALSIDGGAVAVDREARPAGPVTTLVEGNHEDFAPEWSPDGAWIAFHSHRAPAPVASYDDARASDDLWWRRAADAPTAATRLTDFGREAGSPVWSPDGRHLLFESWKRDEDTQQAHAFIVTVDPATGRAVESHELVVAGTSDVLWGAWSKATDTIALESVESPELQGLWLVRPDGTGAKRLLAYASDTYGGVDFSPDGARVVYGTLDGGRMQIDDVAVEGGAPRRLSDDDGTLLHPRVSPDGRWIAATRVAGALELWRTKVR